MLKIEQHKSRFDGVGELDVIVSLWLDDDFFKWDEKKFMWHSGLFSALLLTISSYINTKLWNCDLLFGMFMYAAATFGDYLIVTAGKIKEIFRCYWLKIMKKKTRKFFRIIHVKIFIEEKWNQYFKVFRLIVHALKFKLRMSPLKKSLFSNFWHLSTVDSEQQHFWQTFKLPELWCEL